VAGAMIEAPLPTIPCDSVPRLLRLYLAAKLDRFYAAIAWQPERSRWWYSFSKLMWLFPRDELCAPRGLPSSCWDG